jgi:hypothetical protein
MSSEMNASQCSSCLYSADEVSSDPDVFAEVRSLNFINLVIKKLFALSHEKCCHEVLLNLMQKK